MTFLSPAFFWASLAVAAGIAALHFIVTRQPRASVLPTARFVPDSPATAVVRDARPADLLLMLLRMLLVLAAGAALAKPVIEPSRRASGRVILVDASRATANMNEAADSARSVYRDGDAIVKFDSAARSLGARGSDSLGAMRRVKGVGNISAALIAALREASLMRDKVDSIELVIVSPLLDEERDVATDSIRRLWPGRARLVRVAAVSDTVVARATGSIALRSDPGDPLAVTVSIVGARSSEANTRIVRAAALDAEDSAWVAGGPNVVVLWPASGRPQRTIARVPADRSGGIAGRTVRVVAAFDRRWTFPADSLRDAAVTMRWADGEPAAVETRLGAGCVKFVAIPVPAAGDLVIRPEFVDLVSALTTPCGAPRLTTPLAPSIAASLTGSGRLAPNDAFVPRKDLSSPLSPWLFGIALAAALAELMVRRGARSSLERGDDSVRIRRATPAFSKTAS